MPARYWQGDLTVFQQNQTVWTDCSVDKITKFKEAIKTGLAFALVFGIAMQLGWMNPYWAGWAVAVIALPTAGESIRKGTLRVVGTIPGCLAALVIHALAPQDRWTLPAAHVWLGILHHLPDGEPTRRTPTCG